MVPGRGESGAAQVTIVMPTPAGVSGYFRTRIDRRRGLIRHNQPVGIILEVLLEPGGFVGAAELGIDAPGDDLSGELAGCIRTKLAIEEQHDIAGAADVEVVADQALEEGAPGLWAVKDPGV